MTNAATSEHPLRGQVSAYKAMREETALKEEAPEE